MMPKIVEYQGPLTPTREDYLLYLEYLAEHEREKKAKVHASLDRPPAEEDVLKGRRGISARFAAALGYVKLPDRYTRGGQ